MKAVIRNYTNWNRKHAHAENNFQTVSFDDLAAAAANNVTTIRSQNVAFSDNIKIGPYKPSRSWTQSPANMETISGTAGLGNQLDLGHFLADYGWMNNNTARLGIDISYIYFFLLIPIISLLNTIPISLNGVGVREGVAVLLFGNFGLELTQSLSMGLLFSVISLALGLIGGIFYVFKK